ncbi:MAG: hypothetical protein C0508_09500, partial [Cyanobacteria bacterium PR.023]|nr:hypothetical protein [Cyanobacteria bacterium PR.023]
MADSTEAKDEKKPEPVVPKDTTEKKLDGVLEPVAAKDSSIKSGLGAQDKTETAVALKAHDEAVLKGTDVSELPKVEIGSGAAAADTSAADAPEAKTAATKLVETGKNGKRFLVEVPVEQPSATTTRADNTSTGRNGVRTDAAVPDPTTTKPEVIVTGKNGVRTTTVVGASDASTAEDAAK